MIVTMLIGIIVTLLVFLGFLFFIYAYGTTAVEPKTSTAETKTFPSLQFGNGQTVEARVMFKDRPENTANKVAGYVFWGLMAAQFILGIVIVALGDTQLVANGECPEGLTPLLDFSAAATITRNGETVSADEMTDEEKEMMNEMNAQMEANNPLSGMPGYCVTPEFKIDFDDCQVKANQMEPPAFDLNNQYDTAGFGGMGAGMGGLGDSTACLAEVQTLQDCITGNSGDSTMCPFETQAVTDCQANHGRRLQVGKPLKHGRILMERGSDGQVKTSIQHDLFSAVHMYQWVSMSGRPVRRLQDVRRLTDMWGAFEEYMQVPAVIFTCIFLAVPLWLLVLKTCTAGVVWGILGLNLVAAIYAIVRPLMAQQQANEMLEDSGALDMIGQLDENGMTITGPPEPKPNYVMIVLTLAYIAFVAYMKKKIDTAIQIIKIATTGLVQTPSVFGASLVCFLMYGTYIAFWEISVISSSGVLSLTDMTHDPDSYGNACQLGIPNYVQGMVRFLIICFVPTTFFFFNANLCCCATGLGAWYFHADDPQKPKAPAFVGLKWAFFDSTGPVFVASLIQYAVHEIKKLLNKKANPLNPIWLICRIIWCFIQQMVESFTKMMLMGHLFHGGGLISTCRNAYQVLKNNLGQVLITDMVSVQVVNWTLILFSVGFGVAACAWMDQQVGTGLFNGGVQGLADFGVPVDIIAVLVCCLFLWFAAHPLITLVVVIGFLQGAIAGLGGNATIGLLTGVFFSAITSIIFNFVGKIVHNCTDVIMYCLALEKETGKDQGERFENLYKVMKDQIPTGTTGGEGVAQGKEVAPQGQSPAQA